MDIYLNYIETGYGFPLILLHGNGESLEYFSHQVEYFSKRYCVIAVDTRGHGKSPRGTEEFSLKRFAEDLHDFMIVHKIERAHILGFSDGGNIALYFALKYPEMVEKLILNGANINPKGVKRNIQLPIEIGYKISLKFAEKDEKAMKKAEMLGLMVNEPNISPKELHSLKMPVLVIAGTRDMIRTEHTKLIARCIPNSTLVFIDGDHFIAKKKYREFNKAVEGFLRTSKKADKK